ncbi:GANP domain-containing protein [Cryomyces antarcticus]|nr:hypothetical protein LTR04_007341 [Oleoguttula sp. CCFEE 6159]
MHGDSRLLSPLESLSLKHTIAAPAFTSVPVRRNFDRPEPAVHNAPTPATPVKITWPQPVRDYVQRSFVPENAILGISVAEMQSKLKEVITNAAESGNLATTEWEVFPLPQQIIQSERANAARSNGSSGDNFDVNTSGQARSFVNGTNFPTMQKRKTEDLEAAGASSPPPWRRKNDHNVLEDRISYVNQGQANRMDKRQRKIQEGISATGTSKFVANLEKRKQRFEDGLVSSHHSSRNDTPTPDANDGPVVGTCQKLEKNYFRLTSAPRRETVRPLSILEQTLELLKTKWKQENNYSYICDQFKSLRQDLTVQHIKNEFTVSVYEIHARIALEKGDLGEYNQCQTQLRALYKQKIGGHPAEFLAYRILYFIHTCNRTDMNDVLADLTPTDKQQPAVKHALDVRSSLALGNYHRVFKLFHETPNMGGYLMDMFVARERLAALASMCRVYKPDLAIRFLTEELGFESDQECVQFLCDHGAQQLLEEKADGVRFHTGKAGTFFETAKNAAFKRVDIKGQI